jgi:hypothetical protein
VLTVYIIFYICYMLIQILPVVKLMFFFLILYVFFAFNEGTGNLVALINVNSCCVCPNPQFPTRSSFVLPTVVGEGLIADSSSA